MAKKRYQEQMGTFGLAHVKMEGGPIHPDDPMLFGELSSEQYRKQALRYINEVTTNTTFLHSEWLTGTEFEEDE